MACASQGRARALSSGQQEGAVSSVRGSTPSCLSHQAGSHNHGLRNPEDKGQEAPSPHKHERINKNEAEPFTKALAPGLV